MRTNKSRPVLNSGQPTICARTRTVWPDVVEIIGNLGTFDYVEFASEYGPYHGGPGQLLPRRRDLRPGHDD